MYFRTQVKNMFFRNIGPKVTVAVFALISFSMCRKSPCEEENPTLKFDSILYKQTVAADTLTLRTIFTDCQGDVGFANGTGGFDIETFLFERVDGQWAKFVPADLAFQNAFFSKIPFSEKVNSENYVEGILEQKFGAVRQNSDTIRFETMILDRAGNRSNTVTSSTFIFP